jgi:hypothetical protein
MSDLVERLREAADWATGPQDEPAPDWDALLREAADEIERLKPKPPSPNRIQIQMHGPPPGHDGYVPRAMVDEAYALGLKRGRSGW